MILYNETINIEAAAETEWLAYMRDQHVPAVMATGLPIESRVLRLLTEIDNGGVTYTFQYFFTAMEDYFSYQHQHADAMRRQLQSRYANRYVSFETLLEEI